MKKSPLLGIAALAEWSLLRAFSLGAPVALLSALALLYLPPSAQARAQAVHETSSAELGLDTVNPCNGEDVSVVGKITAEQTLVRDSHGGFHTQFLGSISGVGTGSEGNTYHFEENLPHASSTRAGPPFEGTSTDDLLMISEGSAPNFTAHVTFHITVNAEGELTAEVVEVRSECRG